jgi:hypothetical protein
MLLLFIYVPFIHLFNQPTNIYLSTSTIFTSPKIVAKYGVFRAYKIPFCGPLKKLTRLGMVVLACNIG